MREDQGNKDILLYILTLAAVATLVAGLLLYNIIGPGVHTLLDGAWSAWVTLTHVGFGDVVPTSFLGRVLSSLLIVFGLILFALFTAALSAAFLGKGLEALGP
ncbi:potassium channel family protein [Methylogaea oryzae]|uniref:Potassium channel domain-containing protein n=1 Tax=Methylogaea oryzae TaxID=1295382 RepID=A0A8D5AKT4_9GAMM|nr:potassium channel family protein [Methylogaea oryzae]BBL71461.1 hypothetical protein MoryE10_20670 [Methylogaea oryzae]